MQHIWHKIRTVQSAILKGRHHLEHQGIDGRIIEQIPETNGVKTWTNSSDSVLILWKQ
jgi:hypothetical protein